MRAPTDLVTNSYEQAKAQGATHILMIWSASEGEWQAIYVDTPEQLRKEIESPGGFFQLREVYSTKRPLGDQLKGLSEAWFVD